MTLKWKTIKKWSPSRRREIIVHALIKNDNMIGYTIKTLPYLGIKGFYTLYRGNRDFAMSCDIADTLIEARAKLKHILRVYLDE